MFGRHKKIDPTFLLVCWDSNVVLSWGFVNIQPFVGGTTVDNPKIPLYSIGNIMDIERRLLHE